jgi:hypothetical protein
MAIICPQKLVERLWREIKNARDEAEQQAQRESDRARRLNALLRMMINAGMSDHLPTLREVQADWADDQGEKDDQ